MMPSENNVNTSMGHVWPLSYLLLGNFDLVKKIMIDYINS